MITQFALTWSELFINCIEVSFRPINCSGRINTMFALIWHSSFIIMECFNLFFLGDLIVKWNKCTVCTEMISILYEWHQYEPLGYKKV